MRGKDNKISRLNIEMSYKAKKKLEKLRDDTAAKSLTQVVSRALAVYELLWDNRNNGTMEITVLSKGQPRTVVLL